MALTPPTVASDPASAAHTNTALAAVTTFIATAYTEVIEGVNALRERAVKLGANNGFLEQVDAALANLGTGAGSAATVATDPTTQAQANTAFATTTTKIDTLNSRALAALDLFIDQTRFHGGRVTPRERIRTAVQDLGSPATLTAETLGSDPVTQAHMNTALANTCAFIDTVNTEVQAILRLFVDEFRLSPGNQILSNRLEAAINAFD